MLRPEDNVQESILSYHGIQIIRFGHAPYLLSHLKGPVMDFTMIFHASHILIGPLAPKSHLKKTLFSILQKHLIIVYALVYHSRGVRGLNSGHHTC